MLFQMFRKLFRKNRNAKQDLEAMLLAEGERIRQDLGATLFDGGERAGVGINAMERVATLEKELAAAKVEIEYLKHPERTTEGRMRAAEAEKQIVVVADTAALAKSTARITELGERITECHTMVASHGNLLVSHGNQSRKQQSVLREDVLILAKRLANIEGHLKTVLPKPKPKPKEKPVKKTAKRTSRSGKKGQVKKQVK